MSEVTSIEDLIHQEGATLLVRWHKQQTLWHSKQLPQDIHDGCRYFVEPELSQQLHVVQLFLFREALSQQEIVVHHLPHTNTLVYHVVHDMCHQEDAVKGIGGHTHHPCAIGQFHTVFPLCRSLAEEPSLQQAVTPLRRNSLMSPSTAAATLLMPAS